MAETINVEICEQLPNEKDLCKYKCKNCGHDQFNKRAYFKILQLRTRIRNLRKVLHQ